MSQSPPGLSCSYPSAHDSPPWASSAQTHQHLLSGQWTHPLSPVSPSPVPENTDNSKNKLPQPEPRHPCLSSTEAWCSPNVHLVSWALVQACPARATDHSIPGTYTAQPLASSSVLPWLWQASVLSLTQRSRRQVRTQQPMGTGHKRGGWADRARATRGLDVLSLGLQGALHLLATRPQACSQQGLAAWEPEEGGKGKVLPLSFINYAYKHEGLKHAELNSHTCDFTNSLYFRT